MFRHATQDYGNFSGCLLQLVSFSPGGAHAWNPLPRGTLGEILTMQSMHTQSAPNEISTFEHVRGLDESRV